MTFSVLAASSRSRLSRSATARRRPRERRQDRDELAQLGERKPAGAVEHDRRVRRLAHGADVLAYDGVDLVDAPGQLVPGEPVGLGEQRRIRRDPLVGEEAETDERVSLRAMAATSSSSASARPSWALKYR
jgi:hypothetical protein